MNKILCSLAVLAATTTMASAEVINFYGAMCITAVSTGCASANIKIGQCSLVRFRPPNVGTNGSSTKFSEFSTASAGNYTLASGSLVGTTFQNVDASHIGQSVDSFPATMRITYQKPLTIIATTNYLDIKGDITNWEDPTLACNITFRSALTQQPRP